MVRFGMYSEARQSVGGPLAMPSLAQNLQALALEVDLGLDEGGVGALLRE